MNDIKSSTPVIDEPTEVYSGNSKKNTFDTIQRFLDDERSRTTGLAWNKLNRSLKHKKIQDFVEKYALDHLLTEDETGQLSGYLTGKIGGGQLTTSRTVTYDRTTGVVTDVPGLIFERTTRHITLRNIDQRRTSTLKRLKPIT